MKRYLIPCAALTFIVTPEGKIAATVGGMSAKANVEKTLEAVQSLGR